MIVEIRTSGTNLTKLFPIIHIGVIGMLLFALADNPYGYYQILRWVVMLSAGYTAFIFYKNKHDMWVWIFVGIAILFNPILPIYLSREIWSVVDLIVAVLFGVSMWLLKKKKNNYA